MKVCRACLSDKLLYPLEEEIVTEYNKLTNLNIKISDGMPQFICKKCKETINEFVKFRDKSHSSETTLRENITPVILETQIDLKTEVKTDEEDEDANDFQTALDIDIIGDISETKNLLVEKDLIHNLRRKEKQSNKKSRANQIGIKNKHCKIKNEEINRSLQCGICTQDFSSNILLSSHIETHKNSRNCELCDRKCSNWAQLLAHRMEHLPNNQQRCHICSMYWWRNSNMELHYKIYHFHQGPGWKCEQCLKQFEKPKKLYRHMNVIHGEIKFFCDYCSKGFRSKTSIAVHILKHETQKHLSCDLCEYKTKYHAGLLNHKIRYHTMSKVNCKTCERIFKDQESCDKHKCDKATTVCHVCGIEETNRKLLKHMKKHNPESIYKCHRCPAEFRTSNGLKVHINRHENNKTKHCEYCPAKFYSASVLIKHRRTHTGERPYVCKVCSKAFTGNHNLKLHMRVHGEFLIKKKNKDDVTIV